MHKILIKMMIFLLKNQAQSHLTNQVIPMIQMNLQSHLNRRQNLITKNIN